MVKKTAKILPFKAKKNDPDKHDEQLYKMITELIRYCQKHKLGNEISLREYIAALTAIGRLRATFAKDDDDDRGATAKKYQSAFSSDAARGRAAYAGGAEPDDWFEHADSADDDDDDDEQVGSS